VAYQQCFSRVKRAKHIDDSRAIIATTAERAHSKIPSTDIVSNSSVRIYDIMSQYLKTNAKSTTNKADRRQEAGTEGEGEGEGEEVGVEIVVVRLLECWQRDG
jgi:hypothetical protein